MTNSTAEMLVAAVFLLKIAGVIASALIGPAARRQAAMRRRGRRRRY